MSSKTRAPVSMRQRVFDLVSTGGWAFGIYAAVRQDSKSVPPSVVVGGVLALMIPAVNGALTTWRKQKFGEITSVIFPLLLALGLAGDTKHLSSRPWWFTVVALAIGAAVLFGAVPLGVVLWRRGADERDRTIAFSSMALALFATMILAFAFSVMKPLNIGPALEADWVLYTGGGTWFLAWIFLQRRM